MSTIIDTNWNAAEVRDRFPTVTKIQDDGLRADAIAAISRLVPDYFFEVPASVTGKYHNQYARGQHGLWIHTLMTGTAVEVLGDSWVGQGKLSSFELDCARVAALTHDMLQYGHEYSEGDYAADNHDVLTADWCRHNTDLPPEACDAMATHNGPWGSDVSAMPSDACQQLVHVADMYASTPDVTIGVYQPPEQIANRYPSLPRATLD